MMALYFVVFSAFLNPCAGGQPQMDTIGLPLKCNLNKLQNSCALGYYCHIGGSEETTMCCPSSMRFISFPYPQNPHSYILVGNPCDLEMSAGSGKEVLQRHYFNAVTKQCLPFVYRGSMGNDNNFISESYCSDRCPGNSFYRILFTLL